MLRGGMDSLPKPEVSIPVSPDSVIEVVCSEVLDHIPVLPVSQTIDMLQHGTSKLESELSVNLNTILITESILQPTPPVVNVDKRVALSISSAIRTPLITAAAPIQYSKSSTESSYVVLSPSAPETVDSVFTTNTSTFNSTGEEMGIPSLVVVQSPMLLRLVEDLPQVWRVYLRYIVFCLCDSRVHLLVLSHGSTLCCFFSACVLSFVFC